MLKNKEYLIETDIFVKHLKHRGKGYSALELAMSSGLCFTTVLNASELIDAVKTENERNTVISLLSAVKILGLHQRYSLYVNEFSEKVVSIRDSLFCVVAKINKLVILTDDIRKYKRTGLKIISSRDLRG